MKYFNMSIMERVLKLTTLILLFSSISLTAGDYTLIKKIPRQTSVFTTDHLGNSYLVHNGIIEKYDSIGNLSATFSQKDLGSPQSIDASDPMKILVFYPNFGTIRFLDNKLAIQSTIDLHAIGIQQPILACNTINQTGFWVYDENEFTIKKINNQLKVELECLPLNKLFHNVQVNFLIESEAWIMINSPVNGVIVFDKTGDYLHTISIKQLTYLQAQFNQLFYVANDTIQICNIGSLERNVVRLPPLTGVIDARLAPHRVFLRKPDSIEIYSF